MEKVKWLLFPIKPNSHRIFNYEIKLVENLHSNTSISAVQHDAYQT